MHSTERPLPTARFNSVRRALKIEDRKENEPLEH